MWQLKTKCLQKHKSLKYCNASFHSTATIWPKCTQWYSISTIKRRICILFSVFFHLREFEEEQQQQLLQPLLLLVLSRGKAIALAGEEARQIYGGGGDLWGRNTVMGEWLSTVSYWHLTKCPKQNEFTSLFLNHQAATALTPILTAITRSPISQGSEKFTVTSTFQWAQVSTSFTFSGAGAEEG